MADRGEIVFLSGDQDRLVHLRRKVVIDLDELVALIRLPGDRSGRFFCGTRNRHEGHGRRGSLHHWSGAVDRWTKKISPFDLFLQRKLVRVSKEAHGAGMPPHITQAGDTVGEEKQQIVLVPHVDVHVGQPRHQVSAGPIDDLSSSGEFYVI